MLLSYLYLRYADWKAVVLDKNSHFIHLPTYKMSSVRPSPAAYKWASQLWLSSWRRWPVRVGALA